MQSLPCHALPSLARSEAQQGKLQGTGLATPARHPECLGGHARTPWAGGISSRLDSVPHTGGARLRERRSGLRVR